MKYIAALILLIEMFKVKVQAIQVRGSVVSKNGSRRSVGFAETGFNRSK